MPTAPTRLGIISLTPTDAVLGGAGCGTDNTATPTPATSSSPRPGRPAPYRVHPNPGRDHGSRTVQRVEVGLAGGAVVGESILLGSRWTTIFERAATSAVADEIHLHGDTRTAEVAAGKAATLTCVANTLHLRGRGREQRREAGGDPSALTEPVSRQTEYGPRFDPTQSGLLALHGPRNNRRRNNLIRHYAKLGPEEIPCRF